MINEARILARLAELEARLEEVARMTEINIVPPLHHESIEGAGHVLSLDESLLDIPDVTPFSEPEAYDEEIAISTGTLLDAVYAATIQPRLAEAFTLGVPIWIIDNAGSASLPGPATGTVTGASNATPVVITSAGHGLASGETVTVAGVVGNLGANGTYPILVLSSSTFSLIGSAGTGSYTSGGTWTSPNLYPATVVRDNYDNPVFEAHGPLLVSLVDSNLGNAITGSSWGLLLSTTATAWSSGTYAYGSYVSHSGHNYVCKNVAGTAGTPGSSADWLQADTLNSAGGWNGAVTYRYNATTATDYVQELRPVYAIRSGSAGLISINADTTPAQVLESTDGSIDIGDLGGGVHDLTIGVNQVGQKVAIIVPTGTNLPGTAPVAGVYAGKIVARVGGYFSWGSSAERVWVIDDSQSGYLPLSGLIYPASPVRDDNNNPVSEAGGPYWVNLSNANVNHPPHLWSGDLWVPLLGSGTPSVWSAGTYPFGSYVELYGALYICNTSAGTTDIPGTSTGSITGATNANPLVLTSTAHGLSTGNFVTISGVLGNTAANGTFSITVINANTFSLGPAYRGISAATNASPIVCTSTGSSLTTGDIVTITGALGNTAANGTWTVTVIDANTFSLDGSTGNGTYTGYGFWAIAGNGTYTSSTGTWTSTSTHWTQADSLRFRGGWNAATSYNYSPTAYLGTDFVQEILPLYNIKSAVVSVNSQTGPALTLASAAATVAITNPSLNDINFEVPVYSINTKTGPAFTLHSTDSSVQITNPSGSTFNFATSIVAGSGIGVGLSGGVWTISFTGFTGYLRSINNDTTPAQYIVGVCFLNATAWTAGPHVWASIVTYAGNYWICMPYPSGTSGVPGVSTDWYDFGAIPDPTGIAPTVLPLATRDGTTAFVGYTLPATTTAPGVVSLNTQSFAGFKVFTDGLMGPFFELPGGGIPKSAGNTPVWEQGAAGPAGGASSDAYGVWCLTVNNYVNPILGAVPVPLTSLSGNYIGGSTAPDGGTTGVNGYATSWVGLQLLSFRNNQRLTLIAGDGVGGGTGALVNPSYAVIDLGGNVKQGIWTSKSGSVTGATNTNPIGITTSAAHGLITGDSIHISGVGGNTAANGDFTVTVVTTTTFTIGAAGNGAYISGGTWLSYGPICGGLITGNIVFVTGGSGGSTGLTLTLSGTVLTLGGILVPANGGLGLDTSAWTAGQIPVATGAGAYLPTVLSGTGPPTGTPPANCIYFDKTNPTKIYFS